MNAPLRAAELAARSSYGRLVAYLCVRVRDVAAAEDALAEAFRAALEQWPRDGVPENPEAWLLATARRRVLDEGRRSQVRDAAAGRLGLAAEEATARAGQSGTFPDERLKLLFVCAHPAIDEAARVPLMLQTVLGLEATRIASAMLVAPATMSQRLVRAKAKIRVAGIAFEEPEPSEWRERVECVLEGIYAAYGTGWEDAAGSDPKRAGLTTEAVWLARLCVQLLGEVPETRGLLALLLHCEARGAARRGSDGSYVPLSEQDVTLWSKTLIAEAEEQLLVAATEGRIGRFQVEAAIQSVHAARAFTGETNWRVIVQFYDVLLTLAPTTGAAVGRAAALLEAGAHDASLSALDQLDAAQVWSYQPYWAVRAEALDRIGRPEEARVARIRAVGLAEDGAVRTFLLRKVQH
jgi:predicted RNA polymerase sigma factor